MTLINIVFMVKLAANTCNFMYIIMLHDFLKCMYRNMPMYLYTCDFQEYFFSGTHTHTHTHTHSYSYTRIHRHLHIRACLHTCARCTHLHIYFRLITSSHADMLVSKCIAAARHGCRETSREWLIIYNKGDLKENLYSLQTLGGGYKWVSGKLISAGKR